MSWSQRWTGVERRRRDAAAPATPAPAAPSATPSATPLAEQPGRPHRAGAAAGADRHPGRRPDHSCARPGRSAALLPGAGDLGPGDQRLADGAPGAARPPRADAVPAGTAGGADRDAGRRAAGAAEPAA